MITVEATRDLRDRFEYHGSTAVEHTRLCRDRTVWREWIVFDTVDEAFDFYIQQAAETAPFFVFTNR